MARPIEVGGKTARFILLASICIVIAGLYFGREVFVPLALAVLLSFVLSPVVRWIERIGFPRAAAAPLVVIVACGLLAGIGYIVSHQFFSVIEQLPSYQGELHKKLGQLRHHGGAIQKAQQELHTLTAGPPATGPAQGQAPTTAPAAQAGTAAAAGAAAAPPATQPSKENPLPVQIVSGRTSLEIVKDYAAGFLGPLATAGLVVIFVIFMLLKREDLRDRMIRLVGHGRLNLTTQALDDAASRVSRYLGALGIVNSAYGVCVAGGLWVIGHFLGDGRGFPNVLVWGLLVALFRFVPYVGIWIGAAMPLLLSFALFPGSAAFFATLGLFLALEVIVSQFIEPFWYGASTGMSALAVLVAAVFWTWIWGPVGLLLSTPLTVCLVVMGKYVPGLRFLDIMLGDEPVLEPHVRLYQRLIAADEEEAGELAHQMLEEKPLDQVYDEVMIPALALAEQDHHRGRLDDERYAFVHQNVRSLVEELGDAQRGRRVREAAAQTEQAAKDQAPPKDVPALRPVLPKDCVVNVLCLPARGEADEIVGLMLCQVLELRGYGATPASVTSLASEMVDMIEQQKADIVLVSAMPPAAISHARYLCKRIHARFPDLDMLVGLWVARGDLSRARERIACEEHVPVITTLADAQTQIMQKAQPIIVKAANPQVAIGAK